jgi:hypothetical protein
MNALTDKWANANPGDYKARVPAMYPTLSKDMILVILAFRRINKIR